MVSIPAQIVKVIADIREHPSVSNIVSTSFESEFVLVETEWLVKLPNSSIKSGVSNTGVRALETVYWHIHKDYPLVAPSPRLRPDFPTSLPHINPHKPGDPVFPCVAELPLVELLHSMGFWALLDATTQWLDNAASDELHCPTQGWELMRRDKTSGLIYIDTKTLRNEIESANLPCRYYHFNYCYGPSKSEFLIGAISNDSVGYANSNLKKKDFGIWANSQLRTAPGIFFQTASAKIISEYRAESVSDFESLRLFAKSIGLEAAFNARIKHIVSVSCPKTLEASNKTPIEEFFVGFAIQRPFNLIGSDSPWELLGYRVVFSNIKNNPVNDSTKVMPAQLIERSNTRLLKAVSGEPKTSFKKIAILGCGSLGSKISLHLAKTGSYEFELVDDDYFSSHNNARHGLIVNDVDSLIQSKADLLARVISHLNVPAKPISQDVRALNKSNGFTIKKGTDYILDSTASGAVRFFLAHQCKDIPGRLIHTVLYGNSSLGVIAVEGRSRSVRIDDLTAYLNALCIHDEEIYNSMYGTEGPAMNHFGEGCSSATTIMNDIDLSIMSASISSKVHQQMSNDTPSSALCIGLLDKENLNMNWSTHDILPTVVHSLDKNWSIRILGNVAEEIGQKSKSNPEIETGGLLAGQICHLSNTIYINHLVDAPKGTLGTNDSLIINTDGLTDTFGDIHRKTNGQITFLGTWHSHTHPTPPSIVDRKTLTKLQQNYDLPVVMLTFTGGKLVVVE